MNACYFITILLIAVLVASAGCERAKQVAQPTESATQAPTTAVTQIQLAPNPMPISAGETASETATQPLTEPAQTADEVSPTNELQPVDVLEKTSPEAAAEQEMLLVAWDSLSTGVLQQVCGPGVELETHELYKVLNFHTDIASATLATEVPQGNTPRTLALLVNTDMIHSNSTATIARYGKAAPRKLFALAIGPNGAPMFWGYNSDVETSTPLQLGRWHHVAVSYDGNAATLFLDGKPLRTLSCTLKTAPGPLVLGGYGFRGKITEVQLWKRALTPDEVKAAAQRAFKPAFRSTE